MDMKLPPQLKWCAATLAALMMVLGYVSVAQAAEPVAANCVRTGTAPNTTLTCQLWARTGTFNLPGGGTAPLWYYTDSATGAPTMPGPTVYAIEGETVVVTLNNQLPEGSSLVVHGQSLPMDRVGAAPGASATYTLNNVRAGSFLYEAGLTPNGARQVGMGLYGAFVVRSATADTAYGTPGTAYNDEMVLVLSELDPALNAAPTTFDMRDYQPRYWFINGQAYNGTDPVNAAQGRTLLMRYINATLNEQGMSLLGVDEAVIAFNGFRQSFSYRAVAETIAPGGTMDALITVGTAAVGTQYPLYSANQHLTNNGTAYGGMVTFINVTAPPAAVQAADTTGPTTSDLTATATFNATDNVTDTVVAGTVSDVGTGDGTITAAEYFIDSVGADGTGTPMGSAYDAASVGVTVTIPAAALPPGTHTLYVHGRDAAGTWGAPASLEVIIPAPPSGRRPRLQWM